MYTQFFGNFLLSKGVLTSNELIDAMEKQASVHLKLGTIAIHQGLLTASEVDKIVIIQTHEDLKFGEIATREGYLTDEELTQLLAAQKPDYLLLGQILIEDGKLTNTDFENLISDYQSQNEIYELNSDDDQKLLITKLLDNFCQFNDALSSDTAVDYLRLLYNNLIRFIGNDFTPLDPIMCDDYPTTYCVAQHIFGEIAVQAAMDMDQETGIAFASRYAGETFSKFDEYSKASLEDFLNLHNGLFNVNMSNERSIELSLCPPSIIEGELVSYDTGSYVFPVIFPFGTIHFILSF